MQYSLRRSNLNQSMFEHDKKLEGVVVLTELMPY